MKFDENIPIYSQIMKDIKQKIIMQELKENEKMPSVRNYCEIYGVTSLTMQRALSELERQGVIMTQKGVGSFVVCGITKRLKEEISKETIQKFVEEMKAIGMTKEEVITYLKEEF